MFAVPDLTVYSSSPAAPTASPSPPSLTVLVRAVLAMTAPAAGPVPADDPRVEIWTSLLQPGQVNSLTYEARQGAFAVIDGTVVERACGILRPVWPGQVRVFGPGYHHEVRNTGPRPLHTVHLQLHL